MLPNQKAYEATAKIVGFDNDIAALAKVTPELTEPYARVVAGEASEADYKSLLDSYRAVDGNEAWQGIRAEARGLDDPKPIETVEPKPDAQMSALESEKTSLAKNHEPIDPKEADEILQAMYYAPSSFYKEFGIKGSTLEKLTQAIESGTMTPEQHKLYSDIKEFVTESGGLSKYRAEHAEMIDNRADNDALGEYLAEMRDHQDTIEAEYRQINKIVRKQLVSMGDSDIEETLRGMGIVEKISKAEDMAIDEVTPEWVKVIQPKADKLYEAYKTKEIPELERIHGEALDRLTTLQDRLYTHPTQAKALADKAAIAKTQNEIAKLKAVEWASSGMLRADGVSGIVAGMANGLQYDNDGNITGIDPERFLIGLVGGTMGSAILRGKVGQQALNAAAKKLQPLKDLAINEGNALAAKLHDKIMSSYFAPASFVVPYAESAISKTATNEMPKGFFSQLERVAEDKLPNRFGESALLGVLRNNGVKDEELKWVKVSDGLNALKDDKGNIRKDDFMAYIKDNRYLLTEKENRPTTYEQYTSDGGTDYKEILIQAPNRLPDDIKIIKSDDSRWYAERAPYDGMNIVSSGKNKIEAIKEAERALGMPEYKTDHWKEPNVLMHIRAIDQSKDGDKTLLIEEIQSDWHQEGKSKGYAYDDKKLENLKRVAEQNGWDEDSRNAYLEEVDKSWEAKQRVMRTGNKGAPQAPLSKTWQEYGIKRMIDEAVDGGYDRVAWTTGEVQNKRYDLAKFADEIIYNEKSSVLAAKKDGNEVLFQSNVTPDKLESIIGKEPTRKLMANEPNSGGGRKIAGEELSIGGDGMRGFYDKILPDFTRKYIKKWDSKVEKTQLDNGAEVWSFPVTQTMRDEVKSKGQPLYAVGAGAAAATQYNQNKESTK